jgi:adenylate cyclase
MGFEIERKFLVAGNFKHLATQETRIKQGYLSSTPERTVRVRLMGNQGFITIKGATSINSIKRFEWEKEIQVDEVNQLLDICEPGIIDKTRYIVPEKSGLVFEVDIFHDNNNGLIVAEIELPTENYEFIIPEWLGKEVTDNPAYYNSALKDSPFNSW